MKKTLILIRHGQTLFNVKNIIQGWCDSPLSGEGIRQARAAGRLLKDMSLNHPAWYSSPSGRAVETAGYLGAENLKTDPGLKEMNFGRLEGENCSILSADHDQFLKIFAPFGGEAGEQVHQRMYTTLCRILDQEETGPVICVSHGVAIAEFLRHHTHLELEDINWANCALQILEYEDGTFTFVKDCAPD